MSQQESSSVRVKAAIIVGIFGVIAACVTGVFLLTNTLLEEGFIVIGPGVQVGNPEAQPTQPVVVTLTATATLSPATVRSTVSSGTCGPAVVLGPWQPVDGRGQDVFINASDGWVHADFWSPTGSLKEGYDEVSVLFEPGTTTTVVGVAGQGWKYSPACTREYVEQQIVAHQDRRRAEGKKITTVSINELPTR